MSIILWGVYCGSIYRSIILHAIKITNTHIYIYNPLIVRMISPSNIKKKKGPNVNEITVNGKPVKAVAGQKVSQVLAAARVKMTYR